MLCEIIISIKFTSFQSETLIDKMYSSLSFTGLYGRCEKNKIKRLQDRLLEPLHAVYLNHLTV